MKVPQDLFVFVISRVASRPPLPSKSKSNPSEPMGLPFGLLHVTEPSGDFKILRARDRASLAINPFQPDTAPNAPTGVAMITGADEAIAAHQRVAEAQWREALKGSAAAARVRQLIATHSVT